jgi:hypothetical protein
MKIVVIRQMSARLPSAVLRRVIERTRYEGRGFPERCSGDEKCSSALDHTSMGIGVRPPS